MKLPGCVGRLRPPRLFLPFKRGPAVQQGFTQLCHTLSGFGCRWEMEHISPKARDETLRRIHHYNLVWSFFFSFPTLFLSSPRVEQTFHCGDFCIGNWLVEAFGPARIINSGEAECASFAGCIRRPVTLGYCTEAHTNLNPLKPSLVSSILSTLKVQCCDLLPPPLL